MPTWTALTLLCLVGLLSAERREAREAVKVFKPLASTGFVGVAWSAGALDSPYGVAVLVALGLSWVGDVLLISPRQSLFLGGLAAFLAGHLAFCAAFAVAGGLVPAAAIAASVLSFPSLLVARWLWPSVDSGMRIPVAAYIVVITVMVALAIGTVAAGNSALIAAGALAFYLSDISVAIDRFVRRAFVNRLWGLPLYYGAQLLLAWSVAAR